MDIRLIATDLDGTLLDQNRELSSKTKAVIGQIKALGIPVVLATGRTYTGIRRIYKELGLNDPVITNNGALIYDPATETVLADSPLNPETLIQILKWMDEQQIYFQFYTKDTVYTRRLNYLSKVWAKKNQLLPEDERVQIVELLDGPLPEEIYHQPFYKILGMDKNPTVLERLKAYIKTFPDLGTTVSIENGLDILSAGVSKGQGLARLAARLEVAPASVMAFGDQENDIEMLQFAGVGVAMENAPDYVKCHADDIAPFHDADGLAQYLEQVFDLGDHQ